MSIGEGYIPEEQAAITLKSGDHLLKIIGATEKVSSNGNLMVEMKMITKDCPIEFKFFLVKNDNFNVNATKFFDCFGIKRGDFNLQGWLGKKGLGFIDKGPVKDNGKSYFEIKYLLTEAREAPVAKANVAQPKVAEPASDNFENDIPF